MSALTFVRAAALADQWLARVTDSHADDATRSEARHLRYLVQCHLTHFELHGLSTHSIDHPALQPHNRSVSTRARLQALCALTRQARRAAARAA